MQQHFNTASVHNNYWFNVLKQQETSTNEYAIYMQQLAI